MTYLGPPTDEAPANPNDAGLWQQVGTGWSLIEPSQAWLDDRAAAPPPPQSIGEVALAAVESARAAADDALESVSGFSLNSGTRQSVTALASAATALANAVEALIAS